MPVGKEDFIMKFTLSTKPLIAAANLVIVNSNISKFDHKSFMLQITATETNLILNTESNSILSEVKLLGVGEDIQENTRMFVDAAIFKQLISTLKSSQVELSFTDGALVVTSGKSSFSLPKVADASDGAFRSPAALSAEDIVSAGIVDISKWKYIKEHQLYARAETYTNPVYTYVWVGANGDVLVGDMDNSIFTHSKAGQLSTNCLIKNTMINLLTSLPDETKLIQRDETYVLHIDADSYEYRSQIFPVIESDKNGNYNADLIMGIMELGPDAVKVDCGEIITTINQSALLNSDKDPLLEFNMKSDGLHIKDRRVDAVIAIDGDISEPYTLMFKPQLLRSFLSSCPDSTIYICPRINDGSVVGIIIHTKDYAAVLGGEDV